MPDLPMNPKIARQAARPPMEQLRELLTTIGNDIRVLDPFPLVLAFILGGAIGFERELSGRAAGLRTHILVCVCSTLLMLVSRVVAEGDVALGETGRLVFDPNRMGAGIVTGIGFLGAATVLRTGDVLRGLTTAACIWFVAGLGIVIGSQQYGLAIVGAGVVLFALTGVNRLTHLIQPVVYRRLIVISSAGDITPLVEQIRAVLKGHRMRLLDMSSGHSNDSGTNELVFYLALRKKFIAPQVTEKVSSFADVISARWKQNES